MAVVEVVVVVGVVVVVVVLMVLVVVLVEVLGVIMNFHCPLSEVGRAVAPPRAVCSPSSLPNPGVLAPRGRLFSGPPLSEGSLGRDPDKPLPSNRICWGPRKERERQR